MSALTSVVTKLSMNPRISPPSSAPKTLPSPPMMTIMKALTVAANPIVGTIESRVPMRQPATAASPLPSPKAIQWIRRVLIPCREATSGSSETARMAMPMLVFWRKIQRPKISTAEKMEITIRS